MDIGDVVPDFSLADQTGTQRWLSELVERGPIALYFYPAAMTTGCTLEAKAFRDRASEFASIGAQRVGISPDAVKKQREFANRDQLDFPLLADVDGKVATMFGTRRNFPLLATRRWTFIIDTDRKVVDVIKSEIRMSHHADRGLEVLHNQQGD